MSDRLRATLPTIAAAIERLLSERGPLTARQVSEGLVEAGLDLGADPRGVVAEVLEGDDLPLVMPLDDRYVLLPALLDGRIFTHRVTEPEVTHGLLAIEPDFTAISALTDDPRFQRLAGGGELREVLPDLDGGLLAERGIPTDVLPLEGAFLLPSGTIGTLGVAVDDLVGMRVTADGFALDRIDREPEEAPAALTARLLHLVTTKAESPQSATALLWTICATDAGAFRRPLPPLTDLLARLGVVRDGDYLGAPGFDFAQWRLGNRLAHLRERHDLTTEEALAVLVLSRSHEAMEALLEGTQGGPADGDAEPPAPAAPDSGSGEGVSSEECHEVFRACLSMLESPDVAEAVLVETIGAEEAGAAALGLLAESSESRAPEEALAGLRWLRAKALERLGGAVEAEQCLQAALEADPDWLPALSDLARYASDRGHAAEARDLLQRAGVRRTHPQFRAMDRYATTAAVDLARNRPCWCGSGRKYKACHLGREALPLGERVGWLYDKATVHVHDGPWRSLMLGLAERRSRHWDMPDRMLVALSDPLVVDAALFEGGALADFLARRGALLPDDERQLAEQWLRVERSVFDVEAVRPGRGLSLRDVRTGERHEVRERLGSQQLTAGTYICVRLLPAGGEFLIFGGIEPVPLSLRDDLMVVLDGKPSALELVTELSRRFAPLVIRNTENEPLVICEVTLRTTDPAALARGLDAAYPRVEGDPEPTGSAAGHWVEYVTTHGMQRIRASVDLAGDEVQVHTNSQARCDRVLDVLRGIEPGVTVINDSREAIDDLREAASRAPGGVSDSGSGLVDLTDPDAALLLEQVVRQYEKAWLDEQIPALDGATPRQAAADPTRRPDLIRLLDTFPVAEHAGAMDPDRLREALGLAR
jgi:tetratricopeptide (TPR) repeat protein